MGGEVWLSQKTNKRFKRCTERLSNTEKLRENTFEKVVNACLSRVWYSWHKLFAKVSVKEERDKLDILEYVHNFELPALYLSGWWRDEK